jgi:hypothetical protein
MIGDLGAARIMELHRRGAAGEVARTRRHDHAPAAAGGRGAAERSVENQLQEADAEVRAHEAAHVAAAGPAAAGGASYVYMRGPDGRLYAVGGSVKVDMSPVPGDPEATIRKARALIQAAFAVGQPSGADMRVAAEAYQMEMQAQKELEKSRGERVLAEA